MKQNKSIKKIVLAAGLSNRFGTKNKLISLVNGKFLINHIIDKLLNIFDLEDIIIVIGHDYQSIIKSINNHEIKYIKNKDYKNGIGTSISSAMKSIEIDTVGVMIIPGDMPFLRTEDLIRLEKKFIQLNYSKVVCPKYNAKIGNPIILPKSYFEILRNLKDDFGAKKYLKIKDLAFVKIEISSNFDIDTIENLNEAKLYKQ